MTKTFQLEVRNVNVSKSGYRITFAERGDEPRNPGITPSLGLLCDEDPKMKPGDKFALTLTAI